MFYLKCEWNLCVWVGGWVGVSVCVCPPSPPVLVSPTQPHMEHDASLVLWALLLEALVWFCVAEIRVVVFFTLKIVGAVTDKQGDALWLPGTTSFPALIWALVHPGFEGMECSDASAGARHPSALSLCCSPRLIPSKMIYGVCCTTHPWEVRTWTSLSQSPPCYQEHPIEHFQNPLRCYWAAPSSSNTFPATGERPKDEWSQKGLSSLGRTRQGGCLGMPELPLPHAQGGQRSSWHQREGLSPPEINHQPDTVEVGLHGAALWVSVWPALSMGEMGAHTGTGTAGASWCQRAAPSLLCEVVKSRQKGRFDFFV